MSNNAWLCFYLYKAGIYWLGCKGVLHAVARLGVGILVESQKDWERWREFHRMDDPMPPYAKTYVFQIMQLRRRKVRYRHPKGAVTIVRYNGGC